MATAMARSVLRTALRGGPRTPASKRTFSSSAHHDDAYETAKWEKITYAAIAACSVLAIYNLSKGHPHHDEPPVLGLFVLFMNSHSLQVVDMIAGLPIYAHSQQGVPLGS
ncbi:cytochrome c oxidase-like protein [Actinidia rufa]|uniref:Cytochrome c oxidase-like protein n=1 Tax=Actinidia rufa TaxID=165716 RepID=A0A7J0EJP0_9ERIC|nr:cytochrome c oxidase-like protein [Actinidia rufa]